MLLLIPTSLGVYTYSTKLAKGNFLPGLFFWLNDRPHRDLVNCRQLRKTTEQRDHSQDSVSTLLPSRPVT
jgi:hypothetical protein